MYKKYWKKIIEPLLLEEGYIRISSVAFEKVLATGMEIVIDIQKYRGKNFITINITLNDSNHSQEEGMISALADYRLGDFLPNRQYDLWWSAKRGDIEQSFSEIESIMKEKVLPALRKLEDMKFTEDFIRNIEFVENLI